MKTYTVIDLFAGAGGLSYGFLQTKRFNIVAAAEINEDARKTYQKNIIKNNPNFIFIENIVGCDFSAVNSELGGIDIVIGGPPCQGFSNANRQKNHLISSNNGLVKEFFRAIRQIRPRAFVLENVSMLRSEVHRFYESDKDNDEINMLIMQGHTIPKRLDSILVADMLFDGIDYGNIESMPINDYIFSDCLAQLLSVLYKNIHNERRLSNYLRKNTKTIVTKISTYISNTSYQSLAQKNIIEKLLVIKSAIENDKVDSCELELKAIIKLQKALSIITEIKQNKLIGKYRLTNTGCLYFDVNSYSVIDYINAILGDEYKQKGNVINADWFGVPQERRRYIIIGVRKDIFKRDEVILPTPFSNNSVVSVGDAILDLQSYPISYEATTAEIPYVEYENVSEYAKSMRLCSTGVNNHITTKTTKIALDRFKAIKQGENFHSLEKELKSTYSKPERTQNTIYLRLDSNKPSGTVVNVRKSMWIHPMLDRAITVREAARLQSFPDEFIFIGSKDSQYQQVGNAVPPLLAKGIALKILENLE